MNEELKQIVIRANEVFGVLREPYEHKQHCNEQCGLDLYIDLVNLETGEICHKKLYRNGKGLHFKHSSRYGSSGSFYIDEMKGEVLYIPFQVIETQTEISIIKEIETLKKKLFYFTSTEAAVSAEGQRLQDGLIAANALIDTLVEALGRIESADGFAANIAHEALAEAKKRR